MSEITKTLHIRQPIKKDEIPTFEFTKYLQINEHGAMNVEGLQMWIESMTPIHEDGLVVRCIDNKTGKMYEIMKVK